MKNDENAQFDESVDVDAAQENGKNDSAVEANTSDETVEQIITIEDLEAGAAEHPEVQVAPEGPVIDESNGEKPGHPEPEVAPEPPVINEVVADEPAAEETAAVDETAVEESTAEESDVDEADEGEADKGEVDEVEDGEDEGVDKQGFDGLGLPDDVLGAVEKVGFENPSPIQEQTIPLLMEGRDVVGLAQTGTGKTAAFALPILSRIDASAKHPQALILAPTRELALQVSDSFQSFADHLGKISILPIYGGQAYGVQLSGLRRGAQIIVGTPGRVIDHLERGSLDISNLRFLVLDEADEMLNMGFQEDVERILEDTPEDKQVALFSATMPNAIRRISKQYLDDPAEVTVKAETRTNTNISQRYLFTPGRNKMDALTRVLEVSEFEAMIIFVRTKNDTEEVAENLREQGFAAAAINGDIPQQQRERTVDQLRDGRIDILVATDVAARGLDVERISHVVNYDIPRDTESYVHRIGRTGRAGRSGKALLFVTPRERRMLRSIEKVTGARIEEIDLPSVDQVNEARKAKFADSITASLEAKQIDLFRELVSAYAEANDVAMEDIAAALAAQAQGDVDFLMKEQPRSKKDRRDRDKWDRFDREDRNGGKFNRRDRDDRGDRGGRKHDRAQDNENFDTYRLDVGKRQHVRPGGIVGALANEGGLTNKDFGRITIGGDFSLVELPKNLDPAVLDRLSDTRISGQRINIKLDTGAPPRDRRGGYRDRDRDHDGGGYRDRGGRGGYRDRDDRGGRGGYRDRDDRGGRGGRGDYGGGRDRDREWDSRDRGRKRGWRD